MLFKKYSAGFISILLLSSCGLWGPSYTKPNVDTPSAWNHKDKLSQINTSVNLPDTAWWMKFHDKALDSLIAQALANNNNVQQAIGNIIQAQGNLDLVHYGWVPTISVPAAGFGATGVFQNTFSTGTNAATVGGGTGFTSGAVPSYTLNILQQIRQQQAANAALINAQYTKDAMRLTVLSQVATGYFTLSSQTYLLQLQHQLVEQYFAVYQLTQQQYKQGYISLLAVQTSVQNYQNAKAQIALIENNIVQSQNALQVLINHNPGELMLGVNFEALKTDGIIPINLPSTVLKQRPDVIAAEQRLITVNANIGVATSSFFPSISLTGGVGTATSTLSRLFEPTNDFWQVKTAATFPLLNLAAFGQIKTAKGAYYTAYYNYISTIRVAFQQVDNGLVAHEKTATSYIEQNKVYQSTQIAYQLSQANFNNGLYNKLQLFNAQILSINAHITLVNLKLQKLQSVVNLYQALAGGYNVHNTESANVFNDARDSGA